MILRVIDQAGYFARRAASAYLKAESLFRQLTSYSTVFYFNGGKFNDEFRVPGWYFYDETGADAHGPYLSSGDAMNDLDKYVLWLNTGKPN